MAAQIFSKGDKLSNDWFVGEAFLTPLIQKDGNNNFSAGAVFFEKAARTNWHKHPKGQVLLVLEGNGIYQEKGQPAKKIEKGSVVNIPENIEHWHGANQNSTMMHVAITNYDNDNQVEWLLPVTEEEFEKANSETEQ